jgi:hypothetical protein
LFADDPAIKNAAEGCLQISPQYRINISLLIEAATYRVAFVYIPPCFCRHSQALLQFPLASSEFIGMPEDTRNLHRDRVQVAWRFLGLIKRLFSCNKCSLLETVRAYFTFQTRCTTSDKALSAVSWVVTCLGRSMKFRVNILLPSSGTNEKLTCSCCLRVLTAVSKVALVNRQE